MRLAIRKLIVKLRMKYADLRGHHGKRWNYEPSEYYMGRKKYKISYKRLIDIPLAWMESIGSKMNVYAWSKRWGDRKKGTGYKNDK